MLFENVFKISIILCVYLVDSDEVEYYRKRQQHISTIDTSPARVTPGGLPGYCTLRNGGIPLQDLNNIGTRPKFMVSWRYSLFQVTIRPKSMLLVALDNLDF